MYFWCICGEEGDLRVLLLHHLEGLPKHLFKLTFLWTLRKLQERGCELQPEGRETFSRIDLFYCLVANPLQLFMPALTNHRSMQKVVKLTPLIQPSLPFLLLGRLAFRHLMQMAHWGHSVPITWRLTGPQFSWLRRVYSQYWAVVRFSNVNSWKAKTEWDRAKRQFLQNKFWT